MRIAITLEKMDRRRGGAEVAALRLIESLAARGHEVHLIARANAEQLPPGAVFRAVRVRAPSMAVRQWVLARNTARLLRAGRYDISIACGRGDAEDLVWAQNGAHAAAVEGEVRSYYFSPTCQALRRFQDFYSPKAWMYRRLEQRRFARRPHPIIIAVSRMVADDFQRFYGATPERIRVVYNQAVIDAHRFSPTTVATLRAPARAELNLAAHELAILCVAQNFKRKGVRPLVEAAATLQQKRRDFRVIVAGGEAKHAAPYWRLAAKLGCAERVLFVGHWPRVEELYAAADVFCLPTFYDPCSLTVFEAMACGVPGITSRFNGASELIQHGVDGFVLQAPQDAAEIVSVIEPLFDRALRGRVACAAVENAHRFGAENSVERVAQIVEESLDKIRST